MFSPSLRLSVPNDYLAGVTGVDQGKLLWPGDEGGMPWGCRGDAVGIPGVGGVDTGRGHLQKGNLSGPKSEPFFLISGKVQAMKLLNT